MRRQALRAATASPANAPASSPECGDRPCSDRMVRASRWLGNGKPPVLMREADRRQRLTEVGPGARPVARMP